MVKKYVFVCDCCNNEFDMPSAVIPTQVRYLGKFKAVVTAHNTTGAANIDICQECISNIISNGSKDPIVGASTPAIRDTVKKAIDDIAMLGKNTRAWKEEGVDK